MEVKSKTDFEVLILNYVVFILIKCEDESPPKAELHVLYALHGEAFNLLFLGLQQNLWMRVAFDNDVGDHP